MFIVMSYFHFASIVGSIFRPLEIVHVQGDSKKSDRVAFVFCFHGWLPLALVR